MNQEINSVLQLLLESLCITGCFFTGPTQKSSKYGTGLLQQEKMTKYTGPTQDLLTQKSSKYGTGTPQQEKMTKCTGTGTGHSLFVAVSAAGTH